PSSPPIPGCGGVTLRAPFQVPSRAFNFSKDGSASLFGAVAAAFLPSCEWPSDPLCAKAIANAMVQSANGIVAASAGRSSFIFVLLELDLWRVGAKERAFVNC